MSFQLGTGRGFDGAPDLSMTEWLNPSTNIAVTNFNSTLASRVPRHVVLPVEKKKKEDQSQLQHCTIQKVRTSSPSNKAKWYVSRYLSRWVEFPWIGVYVRVKMDITKWIDNIGASRYCFIVDVQFGSKITPHGSMWLGNTRRLPDDGIKNRCLILPSFEGNGTKTRRERREGGGKIRGVQGWKGRVC